jgi:putative isomerase
MSNYDEMKARVIRGWNTWNNASVLSWVHMPEGLALNIGFKEHEIGTTWLPRHLRCGLVGRRGEHDEQIHLGGHAYDGSFSDLTMSWRNTRVRVTTGTEGDDLVALVVAEENQNYPLTLVLESGLLWNRPGSLSREQGALVAQVGGRTIRTYVTAVEVDETNVETMTPYLAVDLVDRVGISTGGKRTVAEIESIIARRRAEHERSRERFGELAEAYDAMQSCMAWDTIYEPKKDRMVTPVSRLWNRNWGGYVLFCWDTYFGAMIASPDCKELAYSNAIEVTREKTDRGFVPNFAGDAEFKSEDRSQPPVGTLAVREIYRKYRERWLVDEVFDDLLVWNRWWNDRRRIADGLLAWGSDPFESRFKSMSQISGVGDTAGGALESGLDNSPMYDDVPFDHDKHCMMLADVGLTSMYVADCTMLAELADVAERADAASELRDRADAYSRGLAGLWDEEVGIFLNRRTDTGERSLRLSPTNFYALLTDVPTPEQARRMIDEHFFNEEEFAGEWILPSIARNDPAYPEQRYWRGKIWAPMNFLVYLGLRRHGLADASRVLADKSKELLLREWRENGHVHENYTATTGWGCDRRDSDRFYHWGGLMALIGLMEAGYVEGPEQSL